MSDSETSTARAAHRVEGSPRSPPPRSSAPEPGPSLLARVGEGSLRALGVVLLSAVPTALRTATAGGSFFDGLLVGAGVLFPVVAIVLVATALAATTELRPSL